MVGPKRKRRVGDLQDQSLPNILVHPSPGDLHDGRRGSDSNGPWNVTILGFPLMVLLLFKGSLEVGNLFCLLLKGLLKVGLVPEAVGFLLQTAHVGFEFLRGLVGDHRISPGERLGPTDLVLADARLLLEVALASAFDFLFFHRQVHVGLGQGSIQSC